MRNNLACGTPIVLTLFVNTFLCLGTASTLACTRPTSVGAGDGADAYPSLVATQTMRRVRCLGALGRLERATVMVISIGRSK